MKKIIQILCLLFIVNSFAQNSYSKDRILGLYYKTSVSDYGILNTTNLISLEESHYSQITTKDSLGLSSTTFFKLKKGKLISINNTDGFGYIYSYKKNSNLLVKTVQKASYGTTEITYKYNKKGNIIEKEIFTKEDNKRKKIYFQYGADSFKEYGIGNNGKEYIKNTFIEDSNGNIISKVDLGHKGYKNTDSWRFAYDNASQVISASRIRFIFGTKTSNLNTYKYYQNGLIREEFESETSIMTLDNNYVYEYEYDKYGNWIIKYVFSTYYGSDLASDGYKGIKNAYLRKLTYKNGDITGETSIDKTNIKTYLRKVERENPVITKKIPKDGAYFVKISNVEFVYLLDGKNEAKRISYYKIIGNNYYLRDSISDILYVMKDIKSKPIKKEFYKLIPFAKGDEVIWHKTGDDNFTYNSINLKKWKKKKLFYAKNNKDIILSIFDVKKWVFLEARNMTFNVVNKAIPYQEYLKTHPNEENKEVVKNIPSGNVWEKSDNGGFIYYVNGENRSKKINYTFFGDHCVIYDLIDEKTYLIKDIKTKTTSDFNNAIALEGNRFWYKFKAESFEVIINGQKDINIASADYTQNGIDVVTTNKMNEKVYLIKKYKVVPLFTLIPVVNYSDYTEKPNAAYIENEEFKKCKDDGKCYVALFNTKVASILSDINIDNKTKELSIYLEKIYRVKPSMVQKVGILTHTENLGIYMKAKKLLPQHIQDDIARRSRQMIDDYNKYINSKEVRDKVKELGGGYVKSKN